ncbi:MAG: transglycosylase domain-containing protein [Bacteroidota bacterium]|nr:MAG: transglycosylase domain-containing protein [Bacteroidota bacterium]
MNNTETNYTKQNLIFWLTIAVPVASIILIFILAGSGKLGYMPRIEDLENPKINLATLIISSDNEVLGSVYTENENRVYVEYDRLPNHLVDALIATEDIRFYKHPGIDLKGSFRALVFLGTKGGGSTITQQLSKQLFHERAKNIFSRFGQKIKEYVISVKLERAYTKDEIIALYFNQYDFLYNAVGINSASRIYFNRLPDSLRIEESAVLVGMAKNPHYYNPKRFPDRALMRRNTVLNQMARYGFITPLENDSLKALPINLDFQSVSHNSGPATYFREYLRTYMTKAKPSRKNYQNYKSYQEDSLLWETDALYGWCNKNTKPDKSKYDIYTDGLRIYTTINSKMQVYAEEAVQAHLGNYLQDAFFKEKKGRKRAPFDSELTNKEIDQIIRNAIRYSERGVRLYNMGVSMDSIYKVFKTPVEMTLFTWKGERDTVLTPLDSILYYKHMLRTGFMSMDPSNGHVKAYVGGINFRHFKYDHVTQAKRQAGSTFKPFLYILAMQEGFSPCREVPVVAVPFKVNDTIWVPRYSGDKKYIGTMKTLKWGLATSHNYISAWLVDRFKPEPIANIAYRMGIESYIDPVPSMIYGTSDMSVKEMVGAFSTFANQGIHIKPMFVTHIEDKYGNVLATFHPETREAIDEQTAFLMINLLQGVVNFGTAFRLRAEYKFTGEMAGKTGTTNNHSDGWFIGITPQLVSGVWVGGENRSIHFDNIAMGSGSSMALPIWAEYMSRIYADPSLNVKQEDVFIKPSEFDVDLNCAAQKEDAAADIENYYEEAGAIFD